MTGAVAIRYPQAVTPDELRRIRKRMGLSQSQFAALLGVHLVTVKKWEAGMQGMARTADRLIRLLAELKKTGRTPRPTVPPRRRRR